MKGKRARHGHRPARPANEPEIVETIVTCACSHGLEQHSDGGCTIDDCDCEIERGLLLVGKIQAVDEM